ncbi:response regulator [Massilia sp. YIM B02763]|uniref:hybrid sensor histidine kinase/response regulator n=1 Tax=Massilia sp. YIM B02763 TaxID=3050130 RepID=UPI0025B66DC5|nr:PAS domain-containing sensor histidine kinase [Massilia sp. YIM B02763]MDN4052461.1 response regulator [Massilia sp. YIM B02763]
MTTTMLDSSPTFSPTFLACGGRMAARIAAHDWSATRLGPLAAWPDCLRGALGTALGCGFPSILCWGAQLAAFPNDVCLPLLGECAPGTPLPDAWPAAWNALGPLVLRARGGEPCHADDVPVLLERHGYPEPAWYSFSCAPVHDGAGAVAGVLCTMTETTAKVRAQAALRRREQRQQRLGEILSHQVTTHAIDRDRLWRISRDVMAAASLTTGRFLTVNPAFTDVLGWSAAEATARPFMQMVYPDDCADVLEKLQMLAAGTPLVGYEMRMLHRDGSLRWLSWTISPEGELLYGVARDVSSEKQQADALRQAEEALRQSQKMEAVGQLTGGLAHDFNNMLAGVTGHLELMKLRLRMGQSGDLPARIDAALGVTQRAAALTHRLLAFSRRQALDPRPTSVNALVMSMTELIERAAGPAIALRTRLQPAVWTTLCDPNQLESALLNLANNARDAMPEGGLIDVETGNVALTPAQARRHGDLRPGDYVQVIVRDNGAGMPPDVVARAFDPFFTTKPMGQGTGLGLSMVYGFAQQSGGHVRIESRAGHGTEVRLLLPRHVAEPLPQLLPGACGERDAPLQQADRMGLVLVVDDEDDIRAVMSEVLQLQGYTVLAAADAPQALRMLQDQRGEVRPDMLVTDVGLPNGMNGRQLADQVRVRWPQLPVLLVTGYAESTVMKNETLPAQMELLTKPFAMHALVDKVCAMLAQAAAADAVQPDLPHIPRRVGA